jgi:hypothetical protein
MLKEPKNPRKRLPATKNTQNILSDMPTGILAMNMLEHTQEITKDIV